MKGTRHSEEQIISILKQGEAGLGTAELCRQHAITEQTYYRLEGEVRRDGQRRSEEAEASGGGEPDAEARGRGADVG
jgi:putative transposase